MTVKVLLLLCWKNAVTTTFPVVAPAGTCTWTCVLVHLVHFATLPFKVALQAAGFFVKFLAEGLPFFCRGNEDEYETMLLNRGGVSTVQSFAWNLLSFHGPDLPGI